jgi:hypothetical protein
MFIMKKLHLSVIFSSMFSDYIWIFWRALHESKLVTVTLSDSVVHPMACDACQREGFSGFRYRCQKCHSYQLCQDCFWRGRISGSHTNEHEVKEYTTYVSVLRDHSFACDVAYKLVFIILKWISVRIHAFKYYICLHLSLSLTYVVVMVVVVLMSLVVVMKMVVVVVVEASNCIACTW